MTKRALYNRSRLVLFSSVYSVHTWFVADVGHGPSQSDDDFVFRRQVRWTRCKIHVSPSTPTGSWFLVRRRSATDCSSWTVLRCQYAGLRDCSSWREAIRMLPL